MKSIIGIVVGVIWLFLASRAFSFALAGGQAGQADLHFWWIVVGSLLSVAALGAIIGGLIHGRAQRS
ncbi:MAG: hypothetical protein R3E10_00765 [Gemmatimonadota bacterium]